MSDNESTAQSDEVDNPEVTSRVLSFYSKEENLSHLCEFLRGNDGPKNREAVMVFGHHEKRVLYLKGDKLLTFLVEGMRPDQQSSKWPRSLPRIPTRSLASKVATTLIQATATRTSKPFLHRSEKHPDGKKNHQTVLLVSRLVGPFDEQALYTWIYEANAFKRSLMTWVAVAVGFLAVLFPIWPAFAKVWIWYIAVTFLLVVFGLCAARMALFCSFWGFGCSVWLFPRLFDESLGVVESFKPIITVRHEGYSSMPLRLCVIAMIGYLAYWMATAPASEYDAVISAQRSFLDDLYSGNLLTDVSQQDKADIDKVKVMSLEDLLKDLDDDIAAMPEGGRTENIQPHILRDEDEEAQKVLDSLMDGMIDTEAE